MKKKVHQGLLALLVMASSVAYGQQYDERDNSRNDDQDRSSRNEDYRRNNDRQQEDYRRNTNSERYRDDSRTFRRFDDRDLQQAYDRGYDDGKSDFERTKSRQHHENYKNFAIGVYGGLNSTRFPGEDIDGNNLSGRLGYQVGAYVRGGGRLYGQIGVEYFTSSSNFYRKGDGQINGLQDITKKVDQRYINVPVYIGVKLAQSDRGISAVRLQVGAELAARTGNNKDSLLTLTNDTNINALANLGFDAGPLTIDFVYHHGFNNTIINQTADSRVRIIAVNVGFKF